MSEESDLEKTEEPSEQKLRQAREDGQVPRSRELATFAVTMTGVGLLVVLGSHIVDAINTIIRREFTFDQKTLLQEGVINEHFRQGMFDMLLVLAPILGALMVAAIGPSLLLGGWNFTLNSIGFKFNKLNPAPGIKRMFSVAALMEGGKAVLKSTLIGGVSTWIIWREMGEIMQLITLPLDESIAQTMALTVHTTFLVTSTLLLLVLIDVPFQWWNFRKGLRMTKEEVKQENKNSEGSPEVKGRIRQLQREAARKRMMGAVPEASVVVTNPTHYAVAMKYEDGMGAPKVLAKGKLRTAERIIELAKEHKITIMRAPPFARALYHNTEIGQEIPHQLYTAAAQILAYVFQLKHYNAHGGMAPVYPDDLPVPRELDPESKTPQDTSPTPKS
ncbi:flagellar biosynthesis protein FlhB [Rivihabitans pingtungensis]|uniref:flagellar biosynthesis protein FlhB n=1 Tax=Rivihabitans pingtungensis TaxID=1054498 RepID=UPI0023544CB3|nr:flagellar biosynthesis protein FlhB [Rivihabitans pingtungensis]MCK6437226.1 flagellar type III secretion system protein FlhB [Rivihabitans pingtungensis]